MHTVTAPINLKQPLPSPALRRFAWAVLAYFVAVILWGGLVRATGAGAGCGNHWPLCNGTVLQHSANASTIIEFTHRITSGISFFSAVGLLVWTLAGTVRGHLARPAATAVVVFTMIEAVLGALLVKLGLTAQSQSPLRPWYLALHLTNTLLLLAALTLTAHLLSRKRGYLRSTIKLVAPAGAMAGIFMVMIVGVTGSLAALGEPRTLSLSADPACGTIRTWRAGRRVAGPGMAADCTPARRGRALGRTGRAHCAPDTATERTRTEETRGPREHVNRKAGSNWQTENDAEVLF